MARQAATLVFVLFLSCMLIEKTEAVCGNGILEIGELCDTALSACCAPGCLGVKTGGTLCRNVIGGCDTPEYCTGSSAECPEDYYQMLGHPCRPVAGGSPCDVPEYCTGFGPMCPEDMAAPNTRVCRVPTIGLECAQTLYCPGTLPSADPNAKACPPDIAAPSTTVCRRKCNQCDTIEYCPGPGGPGQFSCGTDYNLATTPSTNYTSSCTIHGWSCSSAGCSTNGNCFGDDGNIGCTDFSVCPTSLCQNIYDSVPPPHGDKYEWNRCIQDHILDYEGLYGQNTPGDPGFSSGIFTRRSTNTACDIAALSDCNVPSKVPAPSLAIQSSQESCYIDGAHWFAFEAALQMAANSYPQTNTGGLTWKFTPAARLLIDTTNSPLHVMADILSANPANTCLQCRNGQNLWRTKNTGALCLLPDALQYPNNLCGNEAFGAIGECQGGLCVPKLETNVTNWGRVCRPSTGPCDKEEYCSFTGELGVCPEDELRNQDETWQYIEKNNTAYTGENNIGRHTGLISVQNRAAMVYYRRFNTSVTTASYTYAINQLQEQIGPWDEVKVVFEGDVGGGNPTVDIALIGNRPAIAWWYLTGSNVMGYAYSNDETGLSGWTTVTFSASDIPANKDRSLLDVQGRPAIVWVGTGGSNLKYYINTNTDGSGTWVSSPGGAGTFGLYVANECTNPSSDASVCGLSPDYKLINGRLSVVWFNRYFPSSGIPRTIGFMINSNIYANGTWTPRIVSADSVVASDLNLGEVNGRPAVVYTCSTSVFCLRYAVSPTADGSGTWANYVIPAPILTPVPVCSFTTSMNMQGTRLMEWRGKPYIVASFRERIYYITNSAADGSGTWTVRTDGELSDLDLHVSRIGNVPAMVYSIHNFDYQTPSNTCLGNNTKSLSYGLLNSYECRPAEGLCDIPEYCSGESTECPTDNFKLAGEIPTGAVVRGPCEMLSPCDGSSVNATSNGTISKGPMYMCRPSSGPCDAPEFCPDPNIVPDWWLCPTDELYTAAQVCRPSTGPCDAPDFCTGLSASCTAPDLVLPLNTICRTANGTCDNPEVCDGVTKTCPIDSFKATGTQCRSLAGNCDVVEVCTGLSGSCPDDGFLPALTVCMSARGPCEGPHMCTGSGTSCPTPDFYNTTVPCRASAGDCDIVDFCPGNAFTCSADSKAAASTQCRAAQDICDVEEFCDNISDDCPPDSVQANGTLCHAARGDCEIAQFCNGASVACPAFQFYTNSTTCRTVNGTCDVAETCDPLAAQPWLCPTDGFLSVGTLCASSAGSCSDSGFCTGASVTCPGVTLHNSTVQCRVAQTQCDVSEFCDGVLETCPVDAFALLGTSCVANPLNCTIDECDGAGVCVIAQNNCACFIDSDCVVDPLDPCITYTCDSGTCVQHLTSGFCYVDGTCHSNVALNPANACQQCDAGGMDPFNWSPAAIGASCDTGSATGLCSAQDTCDGAGVCVDRYLSDTTECRSAASACDVSEFCTSLSDFCPSDSFVPQGTLCRNATDICDVSEFCDNMGQCPSDSVALLGTVCEAPRGICETAATCDGVLKTCGSRSFLAQGTQCRAAPLVCDAIEECTGNSFDCPPDSVQPSTQICRIAAGPCDVDESCDNISKLCPSDLFRNATHQCRAASGSCEHDGFCTLGTEECEPVSYKVVGTLCQLATSLCANDSMCTGSSGACPALTPIANGTQCFSARGPCEGPGFCDGVDLDCQFEGLKPLGTVCRQSMDMSCDPEEICNPSLPNPWLCPADLMQADGFSCPDAIYCNGDETCQSGVCSMGSTRSCDDGSPCTVDSCSDSLSMCVHMPDPQIGIVCYGGPVGTADVGTCRSGTIQCFTNGTFYCATQVLPTIEICGNGMDDDCNGVPDDGCFGVTCVDDGDCSPFSPMPCQYGICNLQNNLCEYPVFNDSCLIGQAQCVTDGDTNPFNPCQICLPSISTLQYSADDSQNPSDFDVCNGVETCSGGQVIITQGPPTCTVTPNNCLLASCDSILGCVQSFLPENSTCLLPHPFACLMGDMICDAMGGCQCTGTLIDVTDLPSDISEDNFPYLIIGITVSVVLFFVILCAVFIAGDDSTRKRKDK